MWGHKEIMWHIRLEYMSLIIGQHKLEYMSLIIGQEQRRKKAKKKTKKKKSVTIKSRPHWCNEMFIFSLDVLVLGNSAPCESGSRYCAVLHSACGLGIACEKC